MALFSKTIRSVGLRVGGLRAMRELGRNGGRIVLYHRFSFAARGLLEAQCRHLRTHYNVVGLNQVTGWVRGEASLAPNSIAVTVDDGYRDFYTTAFPVFRKYQIPVTIFLVSDFLDRKCWLWVDQVEYALRNTTVPRLKLRLPANGSVDLPLDGAEQRSAASLAVKSALKTVSNEAKISFVTNELPDRLKIQLPAEPPEEFAPFTWEEARHMNAHGISFGAHTRTHPVLSSVTDRDQLSEEIFGSKQRLEQELQTPVVDFAYPNGKWPDVNSDVVETVRRAGFHSAFMAQSGVNFRNTDQFLLARNAVEPQMSEMTFGRYATAFWPD